MLSGQAATIFALQNSLRPHLWRGRNDQCDPAASQKAVTSNQTQGISMKVADNPVQLVDMSLFWMHSHSTASHQQWLTENLLPMRRLRSPQV